MQWQSWLTAWKFHMQAVMINKRHFHFWSIVHDSYIPPFTVKKATFSADCSDSISLYIQVCNSTLYLMHTKLLLVQ